MGLIQTVCGKKVYMRRSIEINDMQRSSTVVISEHRKSCYRLNHNKGSKSVPLLMKNQLSYTPFILLPQVSIAFHSTFPKISDIQLLSFIFYTTLKLLPTWLSQTLQICERSYFMLKIDAKTPRISLYSSYLHI